VADVRVASTLSTINREAISRRVDVGFDVQGRDPGAVARNVESVLKQVEFPREFHAELLGGYAQRQAARQRTLVAGVVALIGIYLLLQASVDSWRLAALMLLIVPWALAGGVLVALVVGGGVLSLGGFIGLVTILGIAVRNCIMLIRQYQRITEEGTVSGAEIVLQGTRERLAPILMTAITTGLVVAPFAIAGNVAGHEIVHPMALVILGGLISSILLSLFVVPSLYLRFVSRPESGQ